MSDAEKQSVKRCEFYHEWKSEIVSYYCDVCGHEPKRDSALWQEAEAIILLRSVLTPGDTILRHVSRTGMSRNVDLYYIADNKPVWISAYVGHAIGRPQSRRNWAKSQGLTVGGCGTDVGFGLVYNLGRVLYRGGFLCPGETCPSNIHTNTRASREDTKYEWHDGDGGYALNHKWL